MAIGVISDIQRFSLHDGPGIRTTVYLKGCNISCLWCHNPESIDYKPEIAFYDSKCIRCGKCMVTCPSGALSRCGEELKHSRELCIRCGRCAENCPSGALSMVGRELSVDEVFDIIKVDKPYYIASGGGITLSGGEPLMQVEFCRELLQRCHEDEIDTAIETNLSASFQVIEGLLPHLNRVFCDIKTMDNELHQKVTGSSNKRILENVEQLAAYDLPVVIRTPLIPGITDSDENIENTARWIRDHIPSASYELLNYNSFAEAKYQNVGRVYALMDKKPLHKARIEELIEIVRSFGIKAIFRQE